MKNTTKQNSNTTKQNGTKQNLTNKVTPNNTSITSNATKTVQVADYNWKIVIPSIELEAPIAEGTTTSVMNQYVGHFEDTSAWNGNVGLAAHNRGYPVNYFANLKNLKKGEIIEYYWKGQKRVYQIETITKIKDTDWNYLESTKDNRMTLITCVENEPAYRRCIQAIEL